MKKSVAKILIKKIEKQALSVIIPYVLRQHTLCPAPVSSKNRCGVRGDPQVKTMNYEQ
jgi:hypothetical protein